MRMQVAVASDHAGFLLKERHLRRLAKIDAIELRCGLCTVEPL
jgi:hypothetical protein